ncbi:MAG TPA: DUF1501 domain-containing protein [Pirellulales bacterium]|nr:DUF1501 domain-containing protein [Pirellulales bacterium]
MFMRSLPPCGRIARRTFLADVGWGATGLALGAMLNDDPIARASQAAASPPDGQPHFAPKAKNVIWIFLSGGYSHLETFDPKPALNKYAGKTYEEAPIANPLLSPLYEQRSRSVVGMKRVTYPTIFPLQVGYQKRGKLGIEVSDWLPHLAGCVDDISFVRSMYTTDNDHYAEQQFHHGRHRLDEKQPSLGAWLSYGLGSLNENLPQFVALGNIVDPRVRENFSGDYLGPQYGGTHLSLDPENPLPFGRRPADVLADEQRNEFEAIGRLNQLASVEYPDDERLAACIRSYELAYRMQMAAPEALRFGDETEETLRLYGIDVPATEQAGRRLLAARRLAERGVRFSLVYLSNYGAWDSHTELQKLHSKLCGEIDQPVAALLKDLKRRGMWDDTLVVFCTEFGRTPGMEIQGAAKTGRDHHPHGFTVWLAGAGVKRGCIHGATDELGFHVAEDAHYVTDIHATVLHLLGLDPRRLDIPGRKRLDVDYGNVIRQILA